MSRGHRSRSQEKALRRLFLMLFLRGRAARGIGKSTDQPTSVGRKLALVLFFYAMFGLMAGTLVRQTAFVMSLYLHVMTFVLVGLFVASSAGEVLFNKEEADILLHRPIAPRTLLWAKITVMMQVALWLAGAFNLAGFVAGVFASDGGWRFPLVHLFSIALEVTFCTALVVVLYQLCLRWFGRERLDTIMTATQVMSAVVMVLGSQLVPQLMIRLEGTTLVSVNHWWVGFFPPSWFAGIDDALAGSGAALSWRLGFIGAAVTSVMIWLAFGRLANDYQTGLQAIGEASAPRRSRQSRRLLDRLVRVPPLSWWLRDSVSRASFTLSVAYLARDREMKLRVYPGLVPMLIMPIVLLMPRRSGASIGTFGVAFAGGYVGLLPLVALGMLQFSQQWQASDLFRQTPVQGPAPFCHGARRAVLLCIALPLIVVLAAVLLLMGRSGTQLLPMLPGLIALPLYAMYPCLDGKAVPLSRAPDDANAAGRNLRMFGVILSSAALAGIVTAAIHFGWFTWLLIGESVMVGVIYFSMRRSLAKVPWPSID